MKNCKNTEIFCRSINDWSTYILTWMLPCLFFSARFLNMCKSRTTSIPFDEVVRLDYDYMEVDQSAYQAGWGWWKQAGSVSCDQKFSREWNLSFFQAVPLNGLSNLVQLLVPLHIITSFISHFCLFQNAILHKLLKLGFWN